MAPRSPGWRLTSQTPLRWPWPIRRARLQRLLAMRLTRQGGQGHAAGRCPGPKPASPKTLSWLHVEPSAADAQLSAWPFQRSHNFTSEVLFTPGRRAAGTFPEPQRKRRPASGSARQGLADAGGSFSWMAAVLNRATGLTSAVCGVGSVAGAWRASFRFPRYWASMAVAAAGQPCETSTRAPSLEGRFLNGKTRNPHRGGVRSVGSSNTSGRPPLRGGLNSPRCRVHPNTNESAGAASGADRQPLPSRLLRREGGNRRARSWSLRRGFLVQHLPMASRFV